MTDYTETDLWKTTLGEGTKDEGPRSREARERLGKAFQNFRDRAELLANEIPRDLPDFTVHDISHIDALWETAGLVAGPDHDVNPMEGFVLGGAFLIHDLGMSLAAYPEGTEALRNERGWRDTVAALWQPESGRYTIPEELENPPEEIEKLADAEMLRILHARRADRLALTSWQSDGGATYHLIESPELRGQFGSIIGRIAHSHWWPVDKLREEFGVPLGSPVGYPQEWLVDPLKLACLLRLADVCHIDARRAPGFLRAIRQPQGIAREHWIFQERLHQPYRDVDRLIYTSGQPFTRGDASAWWLCFDALRMIDRELRQVDALLADTSQRRLAAHSVAGVEDPERLVRYVRTEGWTPVDARLKVGNVAQLVRRLGGEELYGRDPTVPLRELIQNGTDAVRARRALENRPESWGNVTVRLGEDTDEYWLEVEDSGVGMSADVLTGTLLDFGASYWGSSLMRQELPGVLASGFEPTGQYGIGFFSVFMWGQRVRVTSRRPQVAQRDTLVLEFETGLESRPVLRKASDEDIIREGGTRVRVWLRDSPYEARGLLYRDADDGLWTLSALCAWLAPTLDVDLFAEQEDQGSELVLTANDWMILDSKDLIDRIEEPYSAHAEEGDSDGIDPPNLDQNIRPIEDIDGTVMGRALISYRRSRGIRRNRVQFTRDRRFGLVTVGGLRSTDIGSVGGVFIGKPARAARDEAIPIASSDAIARWATEQGRLLYESVLDLESRSEISQIIRALGGDPGKLPVARTALGWLTGSEIALQELPDEGFVVQDHAVHNAERDYMVESITLKPNVFAVSMGVPGLIQHQGNYRYVDWPPTGSLSNGDPWFDSRTLRGLVIEALARAWHCAVEDVLRVSDFNRDDISSVDREIGVADGETVILSVDVIRNPINCS